MRKLTILKTIIDFLWIISLISLPFVILFFGFIIFNTSLDGKMNIDFFGIQIKEFTIYTRIAMILPLITYLASIYCLYLFKKTIKNISQLSLFDDLNIKYFNTIGILLLVIALVEGISSFLFRLSESELKLDFSLSPFLITVILGLFFMVLIEIFKIAKSAKDENELTI